MDKNVKINVKKDEINKKQELSNNKIANVTKSDKEVVVKK
jgi:hypothetical protein